MLDQSFHDAVGCDHDAVAGGVASITWQVMGLGAAGRIPWRT
jgi:hypothetical protein